MNGYGYYFLMLRAVDNQVKIRIFLCI